jgi:hypothetical protein
MPPARSLTAVYESFLLTPRLGPGVCTTCFNLIGGYDHCFACAHHPSLLAAVLPISYSVGHEQLNGALAGYKRIDGTVSRLLGIELSAVLWRFLDRHEACLASAVGTEGFEIVTTVPSGDAQRDEHHPLRWLVGELVAPVRGRYERVLSRSGVEVAPREFNPDKYLATRPLHGESVLLVDDTWTTGASAQSAAASLLGAGARAVAAVVVGRHVNRAWARNDEHLSTLPGFAWERCALCASAAARSGSAVHTLTEATQP